MPYLLALLIGVVSGLRAMTAPAAVGWFQHAGWIATGGTWLAFFGSAWVRWIASLLAAVELVTDQLPTTPARTVPVQFGTRIVAGAVTGAAIVGGRGSIVLGLALGAVGAVCGTLGGKAARARLASAFGADRPAALLEDAVAIGGALLIGILAR